MEKNDEIKVKLVKVQKEKMRDENFWVSMFDRLIILGTLPQPQDEEMLESDAPTIISLSNKLVPNQIEITRFKMEISKDGQLSMNEDWHKDIFNPCFTQEEEDLIVRSLQIKLDSAQDQEMQQILFLLSKFNINPETDDA